MLYESFLDCGNRLLFDYTDSFLNVKDSVCREVVYPIDSATWPANFDQIDFAAVSQSKVKPQVVLGNITSATAHLINLITISSNEFNSCSNACTVGLNTNCSDHNPVLLV